MSSCNFNNKNKLLRFIYYFIIYRINQSLIRSFYKKANHKLVVSAECCHDKRYTYLTITLLHQVKLIAYFSRMFNRILLGNLFVKSGIKYTQISAIEMKKKQCHKDSVCKPGYLIPPFLYKCT